jgi:hypothetical protein
MIRWVTITLLVLCVSAAFGQSKKSIVHGIVLNDNGQPVGDVTIQILGKQDGTITSDNGTFYIQVPSNRFFALTFSHLAYHLYQKNYFVKPGDSTYSEIILLSKSDVIDEVIVTDNIESRESGLIKINPDNAALLPGVTGGVEGLIKTLVGSSNELTSQYNVRGGNFDENLVYINDMEVFRPYLVSSGQQEGLSIINPELTQSVLFYTGGFQVKYGDKLSSVLDITYRNPTKKSGSVYAGLLEQGVHLEGISKNKRFTYLVGARNKSNQNILKSQPTQGVYTPSASDVQSYLKYRINRRLQIDFLGILSGSSFNFYPESVKKTASVFSPFYSANLGLDVYFEGHENDRYTTLLTGSTVRYMVNDSLSLKFIVSRFVNKESENFDIGGAYLFGDRDFDNTSSTFGMITNPLGAGYYQDYARNELTITTWQIAHK